MPKLMDVDADNSVNTNHGFQYSHIGIEKLEDTPNFTIVHIVTDKSTSVARFKNDLEKINITCVESCQNSPESENLLIRATTFSSPTWGNSDIEELHGYTLLSGINPQDYNGCIHPSGATPLYDATLDALSSLKDFSEKLYEEQHVCNAILFVITDGEENSSNADLTAVTTLMKKIKRDETLESFTSILIGVNTDEDDISNYLDNYKNKAGFDQFIDIKKATSKELAKLAKFVSQSVSSTSQALTSGQPSKPIDINAITI